MANLQVKNVPDDLYEKIRHEAERQGRTIRELVLDAVRREVAREEFRARLRTRRPVDLGQPVSVVLGEVRAERDSELGS